MLYRFGTGANDWRLIGCYICDENNTVEYQWGYYDYGANVDHYSYSSSHGISYPETGTLIFRRDGNTMYFWNAIDSQWESLAFPANPTKFEVSIGVALFWAQAHETRDVDFDNFVIE